MTNVTSSVADLFINLSAGWLGAVIIIPPFLNKNNKLSVTLLIADVFFAMLSLLIAISLKGV